jgi:hypothetical protein
MYAGMPDLFMRAPIYNQGLAKHSLVPPKRAIRLSSLFVISSRAAVNLSDAQKAKHIRKCAKNNRFANEIASKK